jgi:hypothetical protein
MTTGNLKLRTVTSTFFDRDVVLRSMSATTKAVLSKFGAYVRTRAKSSIRKARQKSIGELTADELLAYRIAAAEAKRQGRPRPKRPLAASRPGEPPRSILGHLRKFIYFAWDPSTKSMVVGPALFGGASGSAPRTLEEGGTAVLYNGRTITIAPRPYMRPAYEAEKPALPKLWQDAAANFGSGGKS